MDAALETGADGLGERLLRGEALGERAGGRVWTRGGFPAFDVGEDTVQELVAPAVERLLDALDVAQVGANADDGHRASSISSRIRRTLASSPVKIASPTKKWP